MHRPRSIHIRHPHVPVSLDNTDLRRIWALIVRLEGAAPDVHVDRATRYSLGVLRHHLENA